MSKNKKVLTLLGRKAVWAPASAGVGGGKVRYYLTDQGTLVNADNVLIPYEQAKKDFENVVISPSGDDSMMLIPTVVQDNGNSVSFVIYAPGQDWLTITTGKRV